MTRLGVHCRKGFAEEEAIETLHSTTLQGHSQVGKDSLRKKRLRPSYFVQGRILGIRRKGFAEEEAIETRRRSQAE